MPEAAIIILDNSDFSINGDYEPTRWLNQIDAAGLLIQTKLEQHHQNAMGIGLSAGKQVEIICTPSNDITKVTSFLYGVKQHGSLKLSVALQTSALALKHRLNQNLSQRIICFIASTITDSLQQLKLVCKKLKKNGIALDLVALGDLSEKQKEILQTMHQNINSESNSQLVYVEPLNNLSDILFTTKILGGEPQQNQQVINQAEDPELLMALQLSLQEQQQRLAAAQARNAASNPVVSEQQQLEQRALQLAMDEEKEDDKNEKKEEKKEQ